MKCQKYDLNTEGHDRETGYGKVNAAKALENNVSIDAFTVNAPKKNADVIGVTPISVSTANDAVQTMSVFVGDKEVTTGAVKDHQFTSSFDTTAFADGDYTITMKAYDKDGVELDASERTIHIKNAPVSGYMFRVQSPKGNVAKGATVVVKIGNKVIGEATANEAGNFTIKVPKQAADTKLTLIASKDGKETVTTITVVDKTAPKVTSVKASNKTNKIVVKTEKGATIKLAGGGKTYTKKANKDGEYTFTIKNLKGNAKWRMTVTDTAGNETKKQVK